MNDITLRYFEDNDLNDLFEYCSVVGVLEAAGWKHHKSIEQAIDLLNKFKAHDHVYAIIYKNKVIGNIAFTESWIKDEYNGIVYELGFILSKDYWGMGLMYKAIKIMLEKGFIEHNFNAITVCHFLDNINSYKLINKLGFNFIKEDYYNDVKEMQYIMFKDYFINKHHNNDI